MDRWDWADIPQGLKPIYVRPFLARLKSCPDTKQILIHTLEKSLLGAEGDFGNIDPAAFSPRSVRQLCQLHAASAVDECVGEWRVCKDMTEKHLPLHLECVVELGVVRHFGPLIAELEWVWQVGIPHGARRIDAMLNLAFAQSCNGAAFGSIDVKVEEFVAVDARYPGGVDLREDAALQLEHAVGRVIRGALVGIACFINALRNVRRACAAYRLNFAKGVVENVAPVAEHVEDDSAVVFFSVVPRRTLRGLPIAFEDPVTEFSPHCENAAEESGIDEAAKLADSGQEKLVLHRSKE